LENPINNASNLADVYLAPIPFNELLRNPGWTQNAGY